MQCYAQFLLGREGPRFAHLDPSRLWEDQMLNAAILQCLFCCVDDSETWRVIIQTDEG